MLALREMDQHINTILITIKEKEKSSITDINKDPYHNLDSFLNDERFEIESKIQNIRLQERQQILSMKKKERKGLSNSFYNTNDNKNRLLLNNSAYAPSKINIARKTFMGTSGDALLTNNAYQELNEFEPSSVNDKIPSKFVIDYPNFLKPAKYHPYRRLEDHHVADVIQEARKRHEDSLLKNKTDDLKYTEMFFKGVEDNK